MTLSGLMAEMKMGRSPTLLPAPPATFIPNASSALCENEGREGEREGRRKEGREGGRERGKERGREGGREEREITLAFSP